MDNLLDSLAEALPSLSPSMRMAAIAVLDNPGAIAVNSMRSMAEQAQVSPPTMLRLARRLGFENYETFRNVFKESLAGGRYGDRATNLRHSTRDGGIAGLVADTADAGITGLGQFHDPWFARNVEKVAALIAEAPKTFIVACGATFGPAATFHYVCRMAQPAVELVNIAGQSAIDGIAPVRAGDAVFAISTLPYARPTIEAATFAQQHGARIAILTDRPSSPLAGLAEAAIFIETRNPHFFPSKISLNAALEAVSAAVAVARGDEAIASIAHCEAALKYANFYWNDAG